LPDAPSLRALAGAPFYPRAGAGLPSPPPQPTGGADVLRLVTPAGVSDFQPAELSEFHPAVTSGLPPIPQSNANRGSPRFASAASWKHALGQLALRHALQDFRASLARPH